MLNTIVYTKPNITINLLSAVRLTLRLTLLDSKQNKMNYACICSNTQTAKIIIKLTQIYAHFGNINSTRSGTSRNTKNFVTVEDS